MKRGDIITVALSGDCGKPRPALVVQSDYFNPTHASVTVIPVTSTLIDAPLFRVTIEPSKRNGLRSLSQVMIDKVTSVRRDRVGKAVGQLERDVMIRLNRALGLWLGLAG